jgi:hypothetical protein
MGSDFAVAPGNDNTVTGPDGVFTYCLYWPYGAPWSDSAVFRLVSEDGNDQHDFAKGDGTPSGSFVAFAFPDALPGKKYRGLLVDGDITLSLFAKVDICGLQHPADPCVYLPFPSPRDQKTGVQADDDTSDSADAPPPSDDASSADDSGDDGSSDDGSGDDGSSDLDLNAVQNAAGPLPSVPPSPPFA